MTWAAEKLIEVFARRGIRLWAAGDRLRFIPEWAVTPEDKVEMRRLKADLLALVPKVAPPIPPPDTRTVADVQAAAERVFGSCDVAEVLPRNVADVRWKML